MFAQQRLREARQEQERQVSELISKQLTGISQVLQFQMLFLSLSIDDSDHFISQ